MPFVNAGIDWCKKMWADRDNGERFWIKRCYIYGGKVCDTHCRDGNIIITINDGEYTDIITEDMFQNNKNLFFNAWYKVELNSIHTTVFRHVDNTIFVIPLKEHCGVACYETENGAIYASYDQELFKVNPYTGNRLSEKIKPSFTHPIAISCPTQIGAIARCEVNSIGLLEVQSVLHPQNTQYEEVDEGEQFVRVNNYIFESKGKYLHITYSAAVHIYCKEYKQMLKRYPHIKLHTYYGLYKPIKLFSYEYQYTTYEICNVRVQVYIHTKNIIIDWTPINKTGSATKGAISCI